jgi:NAD(P)H dehydrogenase (quinone)
MGKGGGCVPSKKKQPPVSDDPVSTTREAEPIPVNDEQTNDIASTSLEPTISSKLKVFIVFYSMYGHVEGLAKRMKKGVDGVEGVEAFLYRVAETLSDDVLIKMKVPEKDVGIPEITAAELVNADGVLFGFPTRYGCMAAQMKAFFDSTGQLWKEQKLAGKPAGFFVSTGTQGGGQETTA